MGATRHIQGPDGKMAGSIGAGKDGAPVSMDTAVLRHVLDTSGLNRRAAVTLNELYEAYVAEEARVAVLEAARAAESEAAERARTGREAFWAAFTPTPGTRIPPTYESHEHLPIGTIVKLVEANADKYWNGTAHVKTGPSTWGLLARGRVDELLDGDVEDAMGLVARRVNNVSPCPSRRDGEWQILAVVPER
jgi:hypothetical protein